MKKILIILLSIFILTSCVTNEEIDNNEKSNSLEIKELQEKHVFSSLDKNIELLKERNISENKILVLNDILFSILFEDITNEAIEKKDSDVCNILDEKGVTECKQAVIVNNSEINECDQLLNTGDVFNCNNSFYKAKAILNFDEDICNKMIDDSVNKLDINSCKNEVIISQAIKDSDYTICNKSLDLNFRQICIGLVKNITDVK